MKNLLLSVFLGVIVLGCNPTKQMQRRCAKCPASQKDSIVHVITETIKDTAFIFTADSLMMSAIMYCDSMGNVYLKQISVLSSQGIQTKIEYKDNVIYVKSLVDSVKISKFWKEKYEKLSKESIKTIQLPTEIKYQLRWYQWILLTLSLIIMLVIGYYIGTFWKGMQKYFD